MLRYVALFATAALAFAEVPASQAQFDRLKNLAGQREGQDQDGQAIHIAYEMVSNGSALLERMHHDSMISMYHLDGGRLLMTHYCSAGNQPRLELAAGGNSLTFTLLDATNASTGHSLIVKLVIRMVDQDHMLQEWTSRERENGKLSVTKFELKRAN